MGFADIMGVRLQFTRDYTMEELYEKIKTIPFEAGHPSLVSQGTARLIVWPQMDRNNQIQILERNGKFTCMRSPQPAGSKHSILYAITGGLTNFSGMFGKKRQSCEALARKTGEQINALRL